MLISSFNVPYCRSSSKGIQRDWQILIQQILNLLITPNNLYLPDKNKDYLK